MKARSCRGSSRLRQNASTEEDVPQLVALLEDDSFYVREAAAWPLAELGRTEVLPQLLRAYQRGLDEGDDNDGFSAALIELASLHGPECQKALKVLTQDQDLTLRDHATWLLEFCCSSS